MNFASIVFRGTLVILMSVFFSHLLQGQDIKIPAVPHPFVWETPAKRHVVKDNTITIVAGKETDLYTSVDGSYYVNTVPKLLFKPDSNFIFSAKLKVGFANIYDGGAILVYSDAENWAKLLFEKNEDGTLGVGASLVQNKRGDDSYNAVIKGDEVYLKVAKAGAVFCFYYSLDGKTWKLARTFPYQKFTNMRIGFYAQSPKGTECNVVFSNITYKGVGFTNFFTGE